MADPNKPQLTEEEQIAKKLKMRKMLSTIFGGIAAVSIILFIVMMTLTGKNKETQTEFNTQELRSKLKQLVALERNYYAENNRMADIRFNALSKEIDRFNPNIDGQFRYRFDSRTGLATGMEKDASNDCNGDGDGTDGLTLSINWEPGVAEESNLFWTEADLADFAKRRETDPVIQVGSD
jgi:hypothetical protein